MRKIRITLPRPKTEPSFRCSICGETRDHWQRYIDGRKLSVCVPCANGLTPLNARLGWRHYEIFESHDASTYNDINHLVVMLRAAA